jgi:hypothetical protein
MSKPAEISRFPPPWSIKERKHHNSKAVGDEKTGGFAFVLDEYRLGGRYSPEVEPGGCSPGPTNKGYAHRTRPQARLCDNGTRYAHTPLSAIVVGRGTRRLLCRGRP